MFIQMTENNNGYSLPPVRQAFDLKLKIIDK
jgi:hypothetical protein